MAVDGGAQRVLDICEESLRGSWAEGDARGTHYAYTAPSPSHYPWQWYWDSCFTGLVWRRFDRGRAKAELTSLLNGMTEDGFIGHTIFWKGHVDFRRRWFYNVASRDAPHTSTIQPPLLAWAWQIIGEDIAAEPRIATHHRWLEHNRDLEGDRLLWIVQPDESGLDSSPKFDEVWGRRAHGHLGFALVINHNRRLGWDARKILGKGGPVVCEVVTNTLWGLARLAAGEPSITPALIDRCWDEDRGLFLDHVLPSGKHIKADTWSALAPLALPDLPEKIGRRIVEEHLLDPERYWTPFPPPSVSVAEPGFEPRKWQYGWARRYWRGPTWVNSAWMLWMGLLRLGYTDEATRMAGAICDVVEKQGLREFYEPFTGEGLGAVDFGWSTLVAELADPDPRAARSYL
jgi:mannosylglycerate hydrolase MGH1-like protein